MSGKQLRRRAPKDQQLPQVPEESSTQQSTTQQSTTQQSTTQQSTTQQSTTQQSNTPVVDPRETLAKLRTTHMEKTKVLADLKDQLLKLQDQLLSAQDDVFKSFQAFAGASEQFLVNVINDQNSQLQTAKTVAPVTEPRSDNLQQ